MKPIEQGKDRSSVLNNISVLITEKGIPNKFRSEIWRYLIGNTVKLNKPLFQILFKKAIKTYTDSSIIKKDIDRTFNYFSKNKDFKNILIEATVLLQAFCAYRPDIKYIQGMSYLMVMLLF